MFEALIDPSLTPDLMADGVFDTISSLTTEVKNTVISVASLAAIIGLLYIAIKTRFTISALIAAGVVAALMLWLVNGGLEWTKGQVRDGVENSSAAAYHESDPGILPNASKVNDEYRA